MSDGQESEEEDEDEDGELDNSSDVQAMNIAKWVIEYRRYVLIMFYDNLIFQGKFMIFDVYFAIFCSVFAIVVKSIIESFIFNIEFLLTNLKYLIFLKIIK